jgi:superoxide dismutase, Fe-Mn family
MKAGMVALPRTGRHLRLCFTFDAALTEEEEPMTTFSLPLLPYDYAALEPYIDEQTMRLHHTKHHQAYVDNLNKAVGGTPLDSKPIETILKDLATVPDPIRNAVRNHGGGHANHSLFWRLMAPGAGGAPSGALAAALASAFGSFESFKEKLTTAAMGQFGSGWGWLVARRDGALGIVATANQDSPLSSGDTPLLGVDVWEHAYYLKYQNRRAEYLQNWWNLVSWPAVAEHFAKAKT